VHPATAGAIIGSVPAVTGFANMWIATSFSVQATKVEQTEIKNRNLTLPLPIIPLPRALNYPDGAIHMIPLTQNT
jgi:hypothetical protein